MSFLRAIDYSESGASLRGELYAGPGYPGVPRPGILLVHGGGGLDDHARDQAERYAELGYVVFACDMLGPEVAGDGERIRATLRALRDEPESLVRRARAGLDVLSQLPETNGNSAAIGFCFGGLTVLQLARAGVELAGVVSMHGSLATVGPATPGSVRAKLLVCHGASDPHVPLADVTAFAEEMTQAGADWQLVMYGGAVHGFTHRHETPGRIPGVAYDENADELSFAAARDLFARVL